MYAAAKAAATMLLRHASIARDVPITTLRLYSAYGPWEDPRRLIPSLVARGLEGGLPPLVDPSVARDFVYVDDVVDAFVRSAEASLPRGTVLNIASGVQTTLAEAVEVTQRVFGLAAKPSWGSLPPRIWDTSTWVGEPARAARPARVAGDVATSKTAFARPSTGRARWVGDMSRRPARRASRRQSKAATSPR